MVPVLWNVILLFWFFCFSLHVHVSSKAVRVLPFFLMQAPLELVGLGSSSSMDSFASWKMNGSGMEKEERVEMPLQGEDEFRRSSPP